MDGTVRPKQIVVSNPHVADVLRDLFAIFDRRYPANLPGEKLRAMRLTGNRELGECCCYRENETRTPRLCSGPLYAFRDEPDIQARQFMI